MADDARSQRAAALEEKKRRLEELKARRNRRVAEPAAAKPANLDEYIDGLLKSPTPIQPAVVVDEESTTQVVSTEPTTTKTTEAPQEPPQDNNVIAVAAAPAAPPSVMKHVEMFTIATQTEDDDFPPESEQDEDEVPETTEKQVDTVEDTKTVQQKEEAIEPKVLTEEEMEEQVTSVPFSSFLNTASKKVERVLGEPVLADLFVNYVGETDGLETTEKISDGSKFVSARQVYECAKWTATRDVTDMDWSPLHRELFLSSYHMPSSHSSSLGNAALTAISPDDTPSASLAPRSGELQSDGLTLVWSLAMPTRPEHIFTCGSPVLAARFHPTEAPLVIGACQSGQVVVWDVRAGRLPVQRSSMTTTVSSKGHAHPICAVEIVEGGSGLLTAATDGKVNFWSLSNLRDAAESLQVKGNISCLAVAPESHSLVCGDESGSLHFVQSQAAGTSRSSRRPVRTTSPQHFGMVTSVGTKPKATGRAGLAKGFLRGSGGLILSTGVDWTVKLWAPAYTDEPLLSLVSHSYDYMCDAQWNPSHPSLFATASSNGSVGLWNFASSLEEPVTGLEGIVVEPHAGSGSGLNKLKWSSDGRRMIVSSADRVHVLSMSEDALGQKGDEDERMMTNLTSRGLLERE